MNRRACLLTGAALVVAGGDVVSAQPAPVGLTAEQDHRRMLDLLGIKTLRPGVDGMNPAAANPVNDEAKAGPYSLLPDPLALDDGRVADADTWWTVRRPRLLDLFAREEHGRVPARTPAVAWRVVSERRAVRGGVAVREQRLAGVVDNRTAPAIAVSLDLLLVTPEGRGRAPLVLEFGFPDGAPWMRGRPPPPGPDWRDLVLARGWGYAILDPTSVQADNGAGLGGGIIGLVNRGRPRQPDDLPVDAHELIALCAPRPLFISAGNDRDDAWVDARGMFMATVVAGPVYRLLGALDLGVSAFPPAETLVAGGDLAFRQHAGGHTVGPNWPYFLDFAARYLEPASDASSR